MPSPAGIPMAGSLTTASQHPTVRHQPATQRDSWRVEIPAPRHDPPPPARPSQAADWAAPTADPNARRSPPEWLGRSTAFLTQQLVAAEPKAAGATIAPPVHQIYDRQLAQRMGFAGPLAPLDLRV